MSNQIKLAIGSVLAFATLATISIEAAFAAQQEICMKPQQPVTQQPVQTQQQLQTQQQPYSSPRGIRSK
jgi:hypothetical protein